MDLWCLGVLCFEFLVGKPPFESDTKEDTYSKIKELELIFPPWVTSDAKDLISKVSSHHIVADCNSMQKRIFLVDPVPESTEPDQLGEYTNTQMDYETSIYGTETPSDV